MLKTHGRYDYSPISKRADYTWPDGKRLAIHFSLNVEHFEFGQGLDNDYAAPHPQPNSRSYAWRDFGNRVGAWRLLELAERYDLPYALLVNTELYSYCPEMIAAFRERGLRGPARSAHTSNHCRRESSQAADAEKFIHSATRQDPTHAYALPYRWLRPNGPAVGFNNGAAD